MTEPESLESIEFDVGAAGERLGLRLLRYPAARPAASPHAARVVLMLHGGNTGSGTFLLPNGGLARDLSERGFDVWLLDFRASPWVTGRLVDRGAPALGGSVGRERELFSLDTVAEVDLVEALSVVRKQVGPEPELSVVGHCLGAGALSLATARGCIEPFRVKNLVLCTLGLFYEVPRTGWVKAEDFILERVLAHDPLCRGINPHTPELWPRDMQDAYDHWPVVWRPDGASAAERMLSRLSFMLGQPYRRDRLDPSLDDATLLSQFGTLHLGLYLHAGQMVRRGYAARFNEPDVIDRQRLPRLSHAVRAASSEFVPEFFLNKRVTLIAAAENQVWHRDSVDLMYEWLRGVERPTERAFHKCAFAGYRIQELFWGRHAARDVYPAIRAALG